LHGRRILSWDGTVLGCLCGAIVGCRSVPLVRGCFATAPDVFDFLALPVIGLSHLFFSDDALRDDLVGVGLFRFIANFILWFMGGYFLRTVAGDHWLPWPLGGYCLLLLASLLLAALAPFLSGW
jgi:hypothetical protein